MGLMIWQEAVDQDAVVLSSRIEFLENKTYILKFVFHKLIRQDVIGKDECKILEDLENCRINLYEARAKLKY